MATGTPDVEQIPEGKETSEECAGKKKSKFQTFKKFFAKKKRKESPAASKESSLKPSQSSSDVSVPDPENAAFESPKELGAKGSMGNKALSHESVFISEPSPENTNVDRLSQENIAGKVKALQLQLQSNIRVGSPPQVITSKPCEDAGAVSEDDGLPQSPQEISSLHELLTRSSSKTFILVEHRRSQSLSDTDSEDEQLSSESLSLAFSPLTSSLLPVDFSSPASTLGCLDSSPARHKMALNPRKHRDRIRGAKLTANVPAGRELRLSEEASNTKQLIIGLPDLSNEGCTFQEELISVSRISEEIDKSDLMTLPQFTFKPSLTVAETEALPELASKQLSNGTDTTTLPEFTCTSTSEAAEEFEVLKDSSIEERAPEKVSISNVLSNAEHMEAEHYVEEEDIRVEKTDPWAACDLQNEFELHQRNSATDDILLGQTERNSTEASECLDQTSLPVGSLNELECNEPTIVLAFVEGHDCFYKPAEHTEYNPLDNVSLPPDVNLPIISAPAATLSIDDTPVHLRPVSSPFNDIIIQEPVPSVTTAIKSTTFTAEPSPIPTNEEPQNPSRTSTNLDDYDLKVVSVDQTIAVTHGIIGKTMSASHDKSNLVMVGDLNETKENNSGACTVVGSGTEKDHVATRCTKVTKTNKAISANFKSPQTTTKPIRFTIAPAWQRSVSGGSGTQDDTGGKSPPTVHIKPELFEGTAEKHAFLDIVRPPAKAVSSNDSSSLNKGAPPTPKKQNENRTEHVEIPFGVRLKKASPLVKNLDDQTRDLQKYDKSEISLKSETCFVKDLQKFESPGKSLQTVSDDRKPLPKHDDPGEGKGPQNTRAEGVPKKAHPIRTPEKSMSKPVATTSSEPEWISVAKLKQKCFQGHPLAREQNTTETAAGGSDAGEIQSTVSEEGHRKICVASPVAQGRNLEPLVSAITAADIETDSEEKSLPAASEKEPRQTAVLPVTQKCPAEPPWLSLAKKKAKAWSDMPQIVQ